MILILIYQLTFKLNDININYYYMAGKNNLLSFYLTLIKTLLLCRGYHYGDTLGEG